jgi:hypothetical protein
MGTHAGYLGFGGAMSARRADIFERRYREDLAKTGEA